jgi:methionine biosynthesis protein MetW
MTASAIRADFETIADWVTPGSSVLDLGCGEGELLALLAERKQIRGVGMELEREAVAGCISRGVSAYQGDLEQGLADLRGKSYDYVILNQSLQMVRNIRFVMEEAIRVGKRVIVGIPNFGYWAVRVDVLSGRTPRTRNLPFEWYNSPNYHFMSVVDFRDFAAESAMRICRQAHFVDDRRIRLLPNLRATNSLFELKPNGNGDSHV